MGPTYWQAELYRNGETYDADFPHRETQAEAIADAEEARTRFTAHELQYMAARVAEWKSTAYGAATTGVHQDVWG